MTATEYVKSISGDFLNGKVNSDKLTMEISNSIISIALSYISTTGDIASIWFKDVLSTQDQTTLTTIVNNHDGINKTENIDYVKIQEESTATGGNFSSRSISISANANSVGTLKIWWPYPISALAMKFEPNATQINDSLDIVIGEDTIVGYITSNISTLAPIWTSQNYVIGNKVTWTHPNFGSRVYTCIANTVSNEIPSNKLYWQHGFKVFVNSTVIDNVMQGYRISITDGVNTSDLGKVIKIGSNYIFIEIAPVTTFLASSPTYVRLSVEVLKDFKFGYVKTHNIGESKIGGSYLPTDTIVIGKYTNNHNAAQVLEGTIEYLY